MTAIPNINNIPLPRGITPLEMPELPPEVTLGLEMKQRGMPVAPEIDVLVQEYGRRGMLPDAPADEFNLTPQGQQYRARQRFDDIEQNVLDTVPDVSARDAYIRRRESEWIANLEQAALQSASYERQENTDFLGRRIFADSLSYQQRQDLYKSITPAARDKARTQFGAEYDEMNTPEALFAKQRDEAAQLLAENFNQFNPTGSDQEKYRYVQEELARQGYTPQFAGKMPAVVDEKSLRQAVKAILDEDKALVDKGYSVGGVGDFIAGFVRAVPRGFNDVINEVGVTALRKASEAAFDTDLGLTEVQERMRHYYVDQVNAGPLRASENPNLYGDYQRLAGTMGEVASDLAQTIVLSQLGAGAAKSAGLSARLQRLSAAVASMGTMGAKEGGGAYRTIYGQLRAKGFDHETADNRAAAAGISVGVVNGLLEKFTIDNILFKANGRRLTAALRGMLIEGTTEAAQEAVNILAEFESGATDTPVVNWDNVKRLGMAALAGGLVGGGVGAVAPGGLNPQLQSEAEAELMAMIDRIQNDNAIAADARQGEQARPDQDGTPAAKGEKPDDGTPKVGLQTTRKDPQIIATPKQLQSWMNKQYGEDADSDVVVSMMGDERLRLVDVPLDMVGQLGQELGANVELDAEKVNQIAALSDQEIADLPPAVARQVGDGIQIVDGAHRLAALRQRGNVETIRAYVPQSMAKAIQEGTLPPPAVVPAEAAADDTAVAGEQPVGEETGERGEADRGQPVELPTELEAGEMARWLAQQRPQGEGEGQIVEDTDTQLYAAELSSLQDSDGPFVLVDLPFGSIAPVNPLFDQINEQFRGEETPPIVGGFTDESRGKIEVMDGKPRVAKAQAAGETSIQAYIPRSAAEQLGLIDEQTQQSAVDPTPSEAITPADDVKNGGEQPTEAPPAEAEGMPEPAGEQVDGGQAVEETGTEDLAVPSKPLSRWKKADLIAEAERMGLDSSGTRKDLIGRIRLAREESPEAAPTTPDAPAEAQPTTETQPVDTEGEAGYGPGIEAAPDDGLGPGFRPNPAEMSFSPQNGNTQPQGEPTKPDPDAQPYIPGYTSDLDPLKQKPGSFKRGPEDSPKKVKASVAAARARRDAGNESESIDNIFKIVSDLARRFNIGPPGLGRSRTLSRWAAGFYRTDGSESIRLKNGSYVSTFVHELGHHLHKVLMPGTPGQFPKQWHKELIQLGKDLYGDKKPTGGYASEGWAETVRFLVTNPAHLKERAPTVYEGVVNTLVKEHPNVWNALMDARVRIINSITLGQKNPVNQFIARDSKRAGFSWRNLYDDMRSRLFDRFQRLKTFTEDLGMGQMSADVDPHTAALRASGHISGDVKMAMERGTFDPNDPAKRRTGPGLVEILNPVRRNLELWEDYMVAKRVLEKRDQGYNVLPQDPRMPDQTTNAVLRSFIADTERTHPEFITAADQFQTFNEWLIGEYATKHGLISSDVADLIIDKNLEYITFRHKKTEDALQRKHGVGSARGGFTGQTSGIRRFREGKGEQLFPPLEAFMASMQGIMSRARLNQVAQNVTGFFEKGIEGSGRWIDKIDRPMDAQKVSAENLSKEIQQQLGITIDGGVVVLPPYLENLSESEFAQLVNAIEGIQGATFWKPGNRTDRENREVTVLRDGKPQFYEVKDERLFSLLEGLGNPSNTNLLIKLLGFPGRVLRAGATQYNPSFFVPNFMRDMTQALTMTDTQLSKLPEQTRLRLTGMKEAFMGGKYHDLFLASGADMSGIFGEYYDPVKGELDFDRMFDKPQALGLVKGDTRRSMAKDFVKLGPIDRLNRSFELANRLGEFAVTYEQQRQAGATEAQAIAEAGQAAADITLDFQRGGEWSKQVNEVIPFFNAAMLGTDKLARFIKKDPMKALGRMFVTTIVPSLAQLLLNVDNEDYWAKPQGQRDRYWYFPTGRDDNGKPTYLKLPKPYGVGSFAIAAERTFGRLFGIDPLTGQPGGDPEAFKGLGKALFNELRPTVNIAGLQPLIEVNAGDQGYSFYRDREIVSHADKDLPYGERGATRSSELARVLGNWMDISPSKIDYLIQGWTGGLGRDVVQVGIDPIIEAVDPEAEQSEPLEFEDYLVVRRFMAGHTRSGHEAITRFYDEHDRLKRINRGLKSREDNPERYREYERQNIAAIEMYPEYSGAARRMGQRFSELRKLYRQTGKMDADTLEQKVNKLYDEIVGIARETRKLTKPPE